MRPTWSGSVSFGLVNIPVHLYSATEDKGGIHFHMLHRSDMSPIGYAKVCKAEGTEVPSDEIARAFEYKKDEYVIVEDDDFARADAKRAKSIDILDFVCEDEIDAQYFEKPYYLAPDRGADRPYALLRETLRRAEKVGIAKFVLREREHLAAIKPSGDLLILNQMRFAGEIRDSSDVKVPNVDVGSLEREMDMALALVNGMTIPFEPGAYHDTYTEDLQKVIDGKVKGTKAPTARQPEGAGEITDLMAALKASMERTKEKAVA